jgi:hypothetical protein
MSISTIGSLLKSDRRTSRQSSRNGETKPRLGRRRLQRHLTAFEADLVKAARARLLALAAAARGLAQAAAAAASERGVAPSCCRQPA